ncbi:MAG: hypothetical protein ACJ79M_04330 [Myxococcales bacterium]
MAESAVICPTPVTVRVAVGGPITARLKWGVSALIDPLEMVPPMESKSPAVRFDPPAPRCDR